MKWHVSLILLVSSLYCVSAGAWGQTGHRVTGAIAENYLSEEARKAVQALLPNESMAEAATYADEMRSNPAHFWQKVASPYHYVTIPRGRTYAEVGAPSEGDSVTALAQFRKTLLDPNASREQKQLALRFSLHIIGDLHQPLHAGNGTDRGGNELKVRFFWQSSNLHRVWDSEMIDRRQLSFTEWTTWLIQKITADQVREWSDPDPQTWIAESTAIRDTIYPKNPDDMNWDYLYENMPTVKRRLQQGGVRMAAYLNDLYGNR